MLPFPWLVAAVLVGGSPAVDGYVESFRTATAALEAGRLDEAVAGWRICLEERPGSATCAFHLARTEARRGRLDTALEWIALAIEWGWCDDAVLAWEPDLAALRESGELAPLIAMARLRAAEATFDEPAPRLVWRGSQYESRFSPDGQRVLTTRDGDGLLWDTRDGELVAVLPRGERGVARAAFDPTGRVLVTTHWNHAANVWDARTGRFLRPLVQHSLTGHEISFSADGSRVLLWGQRPNRSWLFDVASGEPLQALLLLVRNVAALSPDGSRMVTDEGLWSLDEDRWIVEFGLGGSHEDSCGFSRAGDLAWVLRGRVGVLHVYATDDGALVEEHHDISIRRAPPRVVLTGDDDGLVAAGVREAIERLEMSPSPRVPAPGGALELHPPVLQPTGRSVAVPRPDGRVDELDLEDGTSSGVFVAGYEPVLSSKYSSDGRWRVDLEKGGRVVLWDREARSGTTLVEDARMPDCIDALAISRDGKRVLICRPQPSESRDSHPWYLTLDEHSIALWDRERGGVVWSAHGVIRVALSDDGEFVAVSTDKGPVQVLDASNGEPMGPGLPHPKAVEAMCFSQDAERLVTGSNDGIARVWRWQQGKVEVALDHGSDFIFEERRSVLSVQFSLDGQRLATTTRSPHRLTLWDPASGQELWGFEFDYGSQAALTPSLSADGGRVCVSGAWPCWVFDGEGHPLVNLGSLCPVGLELSRDGRLLVGSVNGATCCFDSASASLRWARVEFPDAGWLRFGQQLHCDGTPDALRRTHVVFEDGSAPMDCYAERLLDPRRLEAALAGVEVRRPVLPRPPRVELRAVEGEGVALEAVAEHEGGIRFFQVELDGVRVARGEVERATTIGPDGKRARLELRVPAPEGSEVAVLVRALGRDNVLSRPERLWLQVR